MANILVVDDELGIRDLLFEILNDEGHTVELAENAAQARHARQIARPDLVLLDIWMPDTDGVSLLKEWAAHGLLNMPVIMMSGHATIDTAVEATRIGALAFLEKPITLQKLLKAVEQALQKKPANGAQNAANSSSQALGANAMGVAGASAGSGAAGAAGAAGALGASGSGTLYPPGQNPLRANVAGLGQRPGSNGLTPQSNMVQGVHAGAGFANDASAYAGDLNAHAHLGSLHLTPTQQVFELDQPLREARDAFEKAYFEFHLIQEGGSMTRVAEKTGLERTHLYRKLKQLGVDLSKAKRSLGH
jgi:DNA-binding NtrC family response regulator